MTTRSATKTVRGQGVRVVGLGKVTRALRKVDKEAPKAVSRLHREVATEVARQAKSYARVRPRRVRMGHIERAITARGSTRAAAVAAGGKKAPDVFVQEFGGTIPLFGNRDRRVSVRAKRPTGWFLFPAVKDARERVQSTYLPALERTIRQAER